jgi:hypothetical protein
MDRRDPVVMQAIEKVIGTRTVDTGSICPWPQSAQAIYDEVRRLDLERSKAGRRRTAEVEAQSNTGTDVTVQPTHPGTADSPDSRSKGIEQPILAVAMDSGSRSLVAASRLFPSRRNATVGSAAPLI